MFLFCAVFTLLEFVPAWAASESVISSENIIVTHNLPRGLSPSSVERSVDPVLIEYGRFLFNTPLLSRDGSVGCASCHDVHRALSGAYPNAIGIGGIIGHRHAPPLFNLYASKAFMWDGRAATLEQQIKMPLESPSEMAIDWRSAIRRLSQLSDTRTVLAKEHKNALQERFIVLAIASYLHSLVAGGSAFDRYYYGGDETAISQDAKDGFALFTRKAQCATCHLVNGYAAPFTDNNFHSIGVGYANGAYSDAGRQTVTGKESDLGLFKTPSLRNVSQRSYFMHDGSMKSLRDVIAYYNRGGNRGAPNLDDRLQPLFLSDQEIDEMIAFLQALDSPIKSYQPTYGQ